MCRKVPFLTICLPAAFLALGSFSAAASPASDRFQAMDVFELEYAADPQISPDGSRIVYVRNSMDVMTDRRRSRLWTIGFDGSDHRQLTQGESRESSPRWSPDGGRLIYLARAQGKTQIFLRWMDTGQTAQLTQVQRTPGSIRWSPDGTRIAFLMHVPDPAPQLGRMPSRPRGAKWADPPIMIDRLRSKRDGVGYLEPGYSHYFVVPAEGGTPRQLTFGPYSHNSPPVWTPDGKHLLISGNRSKDWEHQVRNSEVYSVSIDDGTVTALTSRNGPDRSPALSPDGRRIAYVGYEDRVQTYQVSRLQLMDREGGSSRALAPQLDRSVSNPTWAPDGRGLYFSYDDRGVGKIAFVEEGGNPQVLAEGLAGGSLGRPYGGGSFSVATGGRFVFTRSEPHRPADLAVGQRGRSNVRYITALNRDLLDGKRLGRVEEIWFDSSYDKRKIQAWLVYPPDFDPQRKYPLLMEIHGGPIANYGSRFAAEMQLYAEAGYVVLYANPRGSTGYGEEFGNLLHHDYPGKDYDDLMSGVDAVIARGFIDEDNLYVTGGSAGGIMSAWIIGKTDRFRAAAVVKPVINWYSKVLVADNFYAYHRYRYPGSPWENPEAYLKYSPISLVGNVSTPTLLMTGDADLRTPLAEAKQFYHALKLRKIETALVRIPGASHNIAARPSQLIAKVANVLAWFERYRTGASNEAAEISGSNDAPNR